MPAGLYFKLIVIVILIILDYFFPRTEIVGQVAWGWKSELWANKCNSDRTGTHYLITRMIQTTCRWIVSLVNSCRRGLEVKGIDPEIRRSLLFPALSPVCFPTFSKSWMRQYTCIDFQLICMMWSKYFSILLNLGWNGTPKVTQEDCEGAKTSPEVNSSERYKLWGTFASWARILAQDSKPTDFEKCTFRIKNRAWTYCHNVGGNCNRNRHFSNCVHSGRGNQPGVDVTHVCALLAQGCGWQAVSACMGPQSPISTASLPSAGCSFFHPAEHGRQLASV